MSYNQLEKLNDNIEAIKVAISWNGRDILSEKEKNVLRRYSGFGGIRSVLYPAGAWEEWEKMGAVATDRQLYPKMMELHTLLKDRFQDRYDEVYTSIKNSKLTAFYTPGSVAHILGEQLRSAGVSIASIYEPSAGAGVFIDGMLAHYPDAEKVKGIDKDELTAMVLAALYGGDVRVSIAHSGFEDTDTSDDGKYDLVVSNIPFGNFRVFDARITDEVHAGKIHNYFFARGMEKVREGGLMAYITTSAFLNNPSNAGARRYLFEHADFVSVTVMPDSLMQDTGNTMAPSHLLIVQKNSSKLGLGVEEGMLVECDAQEDGMRVYHENRFINTHPDVFCGEAYVGKNQYGQPHRGVALKDLQLLEGLLGDKLREDFAARLDLERMALGAAQVRKVKEPLSAGHAVDVQENVVLGKRQLTFLVVPEQRGSLEGVQLGLFDVNPAETINKAVSYINELDETVVDKESARIVGTIRTADRPDHDSMVLIVARSPQFKTHVFKLYSNVSEVQFNVNWQNYAAMTHQLDSLPSQFEAYGHRFIYERNPNNPVSFTVELNRKNLICKNLKHYHKEGTLMVVDGKAGTIGTVDTEQNEAPFHPFLTYYNRVDYFRSYVELRDQYLELAGLELDNRVDGGSLRAVLNENYDRFVETYGYLNNSYNKKYILNDEAYGFQVMASLERKEGQVYVKSDILLESVLEKEELLQTDDPMEALARSLNDKGHVDIDYIAEITTFKAETVIDALKGRIFLNPVNEQWETDDHYLSGNVHEKLARAEEAAVKYPQNPYYRDSLEAIKTVQPEPIPFNLLDFNFGERWIDTDYYTRFSRELFEQECSVKYYPSLDIFKIDLESRNVKITDEYCITTKGGAKVYGNSLFESAISNTSPILTYKTVDGSGNEIRQVDNDATQLAQEKIDGIRNRFVSWLRELPEQDKDYLENKYNRLFNSDVLRKYDGSHLKFPGLNLKNLNIPSLYPSQYNAVWRGVQNMGAIIDHAVGGGKSLIAIMTVMEMKRLGLAHKPMMICLKANIKGIVSDFRKAYPNARILAPSGDDFSPRNRQRVFHEIMNNNWDAVIITHGQFGKIQQDPEIQKRILKEELDNVNADMDAAKSAGTQFDKGILKGLEIRKINVEVKLKDVTARIGKSQDEIDFKKMGIDHLVIDESHFFKNLTYTTRHERVAGLGSKEGSQRALNLLFALRYLQDLHQRDLCATMLSGTPITNSLTELYLLFKYMRPREMKRKGIYNFDAWAAVHAQKTTDFEFSVTNQIIVKERFRHFIKLPELVQFYNEITDYRSADSIPDNRPKIKEILVNLKPSSAQQVFNSLLMEFARTGNAELIGRERLSDAEDKSRMLIATNYAKKSATDLRLINSDRYEDDDNNKVSTCARRVAELYQETNSYKGTQLIFCDIGTPKPDQFNMYDAVKDKLVNEYGIPSNEITYIHEWSDDKKEKFFQLMNNGTYRITLGSTEKLGVGNNVQQRVVAMHHLDIPWRPADFDQRNGRGARPGNIIANQYRGGEVLNFIYATEQSLDNYKYNLLKNKTIFISQMKNNNLQTRRLDEGAGDENTVRQAEYIAILSGDTSLLEKSKLDNQVMALEGLRTAHYKADELAKKRLRTLEGDRDSIRLKLRKLGGDLTHYKSVLTYDKEGTKHNPIQLDGCPSIDAEEIGRFLIQQTLSKQEGEDRKIGMLYGFDLYQQPHAIEMVGDKAGERFHVNRFYAQRGDYGIRYMSNDGYVNREKPKLAARYFLNAIDKVVGLHEKYEKEVATINKDISDLTKLIGRPFEREDELSQLKTKLKDLERSIAKKLNEQSKSSNQSSVSASEEEDSKPKEGKVVAMEQDTPHIARRSVGRAV